MALSDAQKKKILGPTLSTDKNLRMFDEYLEQLEYKIRKKRSYARYLRGVLTHHEHELWEYLTGDFFEGIRFKRQVAKFGYVLDFYCTGAALAVELDGGYHEHPDQELKDKMRDVNLEKIGIKTFRISVNELEDLGLLTTKLKVLRHEIRIRKEMFKAWGIKKPNTFIDRRALRYGFIRYADTLKVGVGWEDVLIF